MDTNVLLNNLPKEVIQIGQFIGLFTGDGDTLAFNSQWFAQPGSALGEIGGRFDNLVSFIAELLDKDDSIGAKILPGTQWYQIPNPDNSSPTQFYIVVAAPGTLSLKSQLGVGWFMNYNETNLVLQPYVYIPIINYDTQSATFILNDPATYCTVGLIGTPAGEKSKFDVEIDGNAITFDELELTAQVNLNETTPSISIKFINLTPSDTFTNPATTLSEISSANVLACLGTVVTAAAGWLNNNIGTSSVSIGTILKSANFLSGDSKSGYSLDLSNLSGTPEDIALGFVYNVLNQLASDNDPIVGLPGENGGFYITNTSTNQYGVQIVAEIELPLNSKAYSVVLKFGTDFSGDSGDDNWMGRSKWPVSSPPPGIYISLITATPSGKISFTPGFSICNTGLNISGVGKNQLFDLNGFTMKGVELRTTFDPVNIDDNGTWKYGFAAKLDELGLPLVPAASATDSPNANKVAVSLLQTNSQSSNGDATKGDEAPANPTFGVAASWVNGTGIFDLQLFDKKDKPSDKVVLPINRQLGPLACEDIGVGWDNDDWKLSLLFDGNVLLGPLAIFLQGLTIGIPVKTPSDASTYSLDLQGLGISFNAGSVSLTGEFLESNDASGSTVYNGVVAIKAGDFALTAAGSYAYVTPVGSSDGYTSLFIFAVLPHQFGGPEFFFVTGIAAGFGYNRGINLPGQNDVTDFPFVALLNDPDKFGKIDDPSSVQTLLSNIDDFVPPQRGEYWFAAGVKFTSFNLLNTSALLSVEFGNELEIGITGISWMSLPVPPPGGPAPATKYAYVELGISVKVIPSKGFIGATAILTPNSYVIDPDCHLTGGFAFYCWFGSSPYSGQFALTLGGYHPRFNPPSYFPSVPRLAFSWNVSDTVSISGDAYFALTPSAIMTGGGLSFIFSDGNLNAWFKAQMDALIQWAPFQYDVDISISVGVSYKLDLLFTSITLKVELGAGVELWGPEMGGVAHIDWYIISFSVPFGVQQNTALDPLEWANKSCTGFADILLPQSKTSSGSGDFRQNLRSSRSLFAATAVASVDSPSTDLSILTITPVNGLINNWEDNNGNKYWVVRPSSFSFAANSAFPLTALTATGNTDQNYVPADATTSFNVVPMNISIGASTLTITLKDITTGATCDLPAKFTFGVNTAAGPGAKYGSLVGSSDSPEMNTIVSGLVWGFNTVSPNLPGESNKLTVDIISAFTFDPVDPEGEKGLIENWLPFNSAVPQKLSFEPEADPISTIQSNLQSTNTTEARTNVYNNLINQFGLVPGINGTVTAMAANPGMFLNGSPLVLQTA